MNTLIGRILADRYSVIEAIGRGGMAEVYKVWDQQRMTHLAMKLLTEELALDRVFLRRFKREANNLAKLQHPGIVRIYGMEQDGRLAFMLLDYIEGETLKHKIFDAQGPMHLEEIRRVMSGVCSALQFAHSEGVIHCDIKPSNIMFTQHDQVVLSDFGIARLSDAATATMIGMGTPAYMAPEQISGLEPTPQTDIYALGIVLFEMLTGGERPFTGEQAQTTGSTSEKVRWEQINLPPPSPRCWNPEISEELEAVVLKCLAKDPTERYASPLDLLNNLNVALPDDEETVDAAEKDTSAAIPTPAEVEPESVSGELEEPPDAVASEPAKEEKPRGRRFVTVLIVLLIAMVLGGVGIVFQGRQGMGPLAMLATEPATATATETATTLSTATASLTPSSTWTFTPSATATLTLSQTPTDTLTSHPTDTPTHAHSPTPSPLPEGYAIVPDVTGLDFYTAGLKLQEAGFVVEKEYEYNPTIQPNEVIHQDPAPGFGTEKLSGVKILIASETKGIFGGHIEGNKEKSIYESLPENTWCQFSMTNVSKINSDKAYYSAGGNLISPDGEEIRLGRDLEFITTVSGIYYTADVN